MDSNQVNFWLNANVENFNLGDLPVIRAKLEELDDNQMMFLQGVKFKKPSTVFLIALLLGWERFLLNDTGVGIIKVITAYGCGIWWLIDIFSAKKRAQKYNLQQFQKATSGFANGNVNKFIPAPVSSDNEISNQPISSQVSTAPQNYYYPTSEQRSSENIMKNLLNRVKQLLIRPYAEYQTIENENLPHTKVLTNYVLLLAIIPFLFALIGYGLIGYSYGGYHMSNVGIGFRWAFYQLFLLFGGIYITTLIINALADNFGATKNFNHAFSLVAYAYTPMFVAGIFHIWNGFSWIVYAVGIYGLCLLIAGLKPMMKPTDEKADSYSVVSFIVAVVVFVVLWKVLEAIMLPSMHSLPSYHF